MKFINKVIGGFLLVAASSTTAAAVGFPSIGGLPGIASPKTSSPAADPVAAQSAFFGKFLQARLEVNLAQSELCEAFGLKEQVERLKLEQTALASGALDKDGYNKSKELSDSTNAAINEKIAASAPLTEEGRAHYVQSLPHLLKGTLLSIQLPVEAANFVTVAKAAATSASLQDKLRLGGMAMTAALIVKDMPGFVSTTASTYKKVVTYGQANNIPVPKDATDALGTI